MRYAFGEWIYKKAKKDKQIVLLVGDIGFGVFDKFRKEFPERFLNLGIAEQSLVGIAAGLALEGFKPYVYTITPFLIERAFEQIKIDVDSMNLNVTLVGYADYPEQGITHSELNAHIMDILPKIINYYPTSSKQTLIYLEDAYKHTGPKFFSLKKDGKP